MGLTPGQYKQLLAPINPRRVGRRDGMSHLEAYDVRAHLVRIFGFGGWDGEVLEVVPMFETVGEKTRDGRTWRTYSVGYRCTYRLTVRDPGGAVLAVYTEAATGDATNFPETKRADAHDFAVKTAESQALKRCAINLGDQFGLSLYNAGSTAGLIGRTLVGPDGDGGPQQPVDGHVTHVAPEDGPAGRAEPEVSTPPAPEAAPARQDSTDIADSLRRDVLAATTRRQLAGLLAEAGKQRVAGALTADADGHGMTLETLINRRLKAVKA